MNTFFAVLLAALIAAFSGGCTQRTTAPPVQPPINQNQGITLNKLNYTVVSDDAYYAAAKGDPFSTEQEQRSFAVIPLDATGQQSSDGQSAGSYMVLIASGMRTTGGYSLSVKTVEDNEGTTTIVVEETSPAKDAMVIQMITYPHVIITFSGSTPNIRVVDAKGAEFPHLK